MFVGRVRRVGRCLSSLPFECFCREIVRTSFLFGVDCGRLKRFTCVCVCVYVYGREGRRKERRGGSRLISCRRKMRISL